jgi:Flp pilus assembly protein TadD
MTRWVAVVALVLVVLPARGYEAIRTPTTHYHYDIGVAAIQESEFARAIDNLKLVIRDEPRNADAHDWLGFAYARSGNPALATRHIGEALKLDPKHLRAHLHLGELQMAAGDRKRAAETLDALRRLCKPCEETVELERALATVR